MMQPLANRTEGIAVECACNRLAVINIGDGWRVILICNVDMVMNHLRKRELTTIAYSPNISLIGKSAYRSGPQNGLRSRLFVKSQ